MDLKKKRLQELSAQKEQRKLKVIHAAIQTFTGKGIEQTTMIDIAASAQVGVASVYRYFKTKTDLIVAAAEVYWEEDINLYYKNYLANNPLPGTGLNQVEYYLNLYLELFDTHKQFIKFLEQFDSYIIKENIKPERLQNYDNITNLSSQVLEEAIRLGQQDGSIRKDLDTHYYTHTTSLALIGICQKHVSRSTIIPSDTTFQGRNEIKLLIQICLDYLKVFH